MVAPLGRCSGRKSSQVRKFFLAVDMKNCGRHNVGKHKEISGSDNFVTLDILSKFDSLDKIKITSSESKGKLERTGKGLITSLCFKAKARSQKQKKTRYAIRNVSEKEIFKIIKEFEKIEKLPYEKKRPNHEPKESYFHIAKQLAKCMMRSNNLNWYDHSGYKEMTDASLNVNVTNEGKSKGSIAKKKLSQICSTNENK